MNANQDTEAQQETEAEQKQEQETEAEQKQEQEQEQEQSVDDFGPDHLLNDPNNFPELDGKAPPKEPPPAAWKDGAKKLYLPARTPDGRKVIALWDPRIAGWYKTISEVSAEVFAELAARKDQLDLYEQNGRFHIGEEQDARIAPWPAFTAASEDDLRGIIDRACVFYDRPKPDKPPVRLREPFKPAVKDLTRRRYKELRSKFNSVLDERLKHVSDPLIVAIVGFAKSWARSHRGEGIVKPSSEFHAAFLTYLAESGMQVPDKARSAGRMTEALDGQEDTLKELGAEYRYHRTGKSRTVSLIWIGEGV